MSEPNVTKPDALETSREFAEGRDAFHAGYSDKCCPYPASRGGSSRRTCWMFGYWGTRVDSFLARLEARRR